MMDKAEIRDALAECPLIVQVNMRTRRVFSLCIADQGRGWVRVLGRGIAWKPASDPMLFSERQPDAPSLKVGPLRIRWLPLVTAQPAC
jgi:hypothetical protein